MGDDHPDDLLAAVALDAVDDVERRRVMRHVDGCATCRAALDALEETAASLSTTTAPVSEDLRKRVMASVDADLAPGRRSRRTGRLMAAAAVVAVVAAGGVGVAVWSANRAAEPPGVTHDDTMNQVLAAPDMEKATGTVGSGTVAAMYAPSMRATVVSVDDLPAVDEAMGYQVWITVGGQMKSAGMVGGGHGDSAVLMTDMGRPAGVGLSVEPMTGSPAPSSPLVVSFPMK